MSSSDSVSIFAEGTFAEQVQELVTYLARTRSEADRATFIQPFQEALRGGAGGKPIDEDLDRRRQVVSLVVDAIDGLGDGSDREIEGFFNLVFSHLFSAFAADSPELPKHLLHIVEVLQGSPTENVYLKYRVLANLFNAIPRTSPSRLLVCKALLKLTAENDEIDTLQLGSSDVERWLNEWRASPEEKSDFLRTVADTFDEANRPENAYSFYTLYVRSLPSSSPSAISVGSTLIASALRLPSVFDFESLTKLEVVQSLSSTPLYALLQVFIKQGLSEYKAWQQINQSALEEFKLDSAQLERKMRLIILASLGFEKVGQNVSYSEIAVALQIEPSEVEKWVIDVIRVGLLSGKLSQTTQTLHVVRSSPRGFGAEHWKALEQRLVAWKTGLAGIQDVLSATRQGGTSASTGVNGTDRAMQEQVA